MYKRQVHDDVVTKLLMSIEVSLADAEVHQHASIGSLWPECYEYNRHIASFVPDGIIINTSAKRPGIHVIEFARSLTELPEGVEQKENAKRNNYLGTVIFLRRQFPGREVTFHPFIMSIHTSVQEKVWLTKLQKVGLKRHEAEGVVKGCVRECVLAVHKLYNTRQ